MTGAAAAPSKPEPPVLDWLTGICAEDTMNKCSNIVRFIGNAASEMEGMGLGKEDGYAIFLILQTVADALDWASSEAAGTRAG